MHKQAQRYTYIHTALGATAGEARGKETAQLPQGKRRAGTS